MSAYSWMHWLHIWVMGYRIGSDLVVNALILSVPLGFTLASQLGLVPSAAVSVSVVAYPLVPAALLVLILRLEPAFQWCEVFKYCRGIHLARTR